MSNEQIGARISDETKQAAVIWGFIAFILAIISVVFNDSAMVLRAGFIAKTFAIIFGTAIGTIGALLGNWIRNLIRPDFIMTNSTSSLIWAKIVWAVGPQLGGLIIGVFVGAALVLN